MYKKMAATAFFILFLNCQVMIQMLRLCLIYECFPYARKQSQCLHLSVQLLDILGIGSEIQQKLPSENSAFGKNHFLIKFHSVEITLA